MGLFVLSDSLPVLVVLACSATNGLLTNLYLVGAAMFPEVHLPPENLISHVSRGHVRFEKASRYVERPP